MDEEYFKVYAHRIGHLFTILEELEDYPDLYDMDWELLANPQPELIEALEDRLREDAQADDYQDCIAEVAVAVFIKEKRYSTLPLVIEWMSVDEELEDVRFGDLITDKGAEILAGLGAEQPQLIKALADRRDVSPYVYGAAIQALIFLWATHALPAPRLNEWINAWMDEALVKRDSELGTQLALALSDYPVRRFLPKLELLFESEIIDPDFDEFETFRLQAEEESDTKCREKLVHKLATITDFVPWIKDIIKRHQPAPKHKPFKYGGPSFAKDNSYQRNDWVRVGKGDQTADMKYKKAEPLLKEGWKILMRLPKK